MKRASRRGFMVLMFFALGCDSRQAQNTQVSTTAPVQKQKVFAQKKEVEEVLPMEEPPQPPSSPSMLYGLDLHLRFAKRDAAGKLTCPSVKTEVYRGERLTYKKPLRIYPEFRGRLIRFEQIAKELAIATYGRAPWRVLHLGSYNCRTIRTRPMFLSEHAWGNALDVSGFSFRAAPKGSPRSKFSKAFRVDVLKHWGAQEGAGAVHATFLKKLAQRLYEEEVFRGMIVPPAPGHDNHFHLDMGQWTFFYGDPWQMPQGSSSR